MEGLLFCCGLKTQTEQEWQKSGQPSANTVTVGRMAQPRAGKQPWPFGGYCNKGEEMKWEGVGCLFRRAGAIKSQASTGHV